MYEYKLVIFEDFTNGADNTSVEPSMRLLKQIPVKQC